MHYFISKDGIKSGPLALEQIDKSLLTEDCLVWREGLDEWKNIKEIPELNKYIIQLPPPTPSEILTEKIILFRQESLEALVPIWLMAHITSFVLIFSAIGGLKSPSEILEYERNLPYPLYFLNTREAYIDLSLISLSISAIPALLACVMYYMTSKYKRDVSLGCASKTATTTNALQQENLNFKWVAIMMIGLCLFFYAILLFIVRW